MQKCAVIQLFSQKYEPLRISQPLYRLMRAWVPCRDTFYIS